MMIKGRSAALLIACLASSVVGFAPVAFSGNARVSTEMKASKSSNPLINFVQKSVVLPLLLAGVSLTLQQPEAAMAESSRTIAEISGSGLVFKDTLVVESFDDPKVNIIVYDAFCK